MGRCLVCYEVDHLDRGADYKIEMPIDAEILTVVPVGGFLNFWCLVRKEAEMEKRVFRILMAGQDVEDSLKYINTVAMGMSQWAFHVFEVI